MKNSLYTTPGYLKLTGLVTYSGLSRRTLWTMIGQGLPFFQTVGPTGRHGNIMVKVSDFDEFMARYRQGQDPKQIAEAMPK